MRLPCVRSCLLLLPLVGVMSPGCDQGQSCTLESRPSVSLSVVDAETGEDVDATVTFELDGDGPRMPEEGWPGTYVLASEQEGTFSVTISADGYETVMEEYEVGADGCHVDTVEDTIELVPTM